MDRLSTVRIVILNQFFYPDHSATSQLMTELAESLVERGHQVTALASRGRYNGGERFQSREIYKGVHIERVRATSFGKKSSIGRLSDYLSFYLAASWKLLRLPRHDIVMALTTPPLIALIAVIISRWRGMRAVSLVQDVYPDVAVALGSLNQRSLTTRFLNRLSRAALRRSDRIIALGECMRDRIATKVGPDAASRIDVIHNWADGTKITPIESQSSPFRISNDLEDKFVVLFSGNLGRVNDFSTVLEAARILSDQPEVVFVFVGGGTEAAGISRFIHEHKLDNVRTLPYHPQGLLPFVLGAADVSLVTLREGLAGLSVPSKTYTIMASGRPVLFIGDTKSDIARIVDENGCGAVVPAGESELAARIIRDWATNKTKLDGMKAASRIAFEKYFERQQAVDAYLESFTRCMELPLPTKSQETSLKEAAQ